MKALDLVVDLLLWVLDVVLWTIDMLSIVVDGVFWWSVCGTAGNWLILACWATVAWLHPPVIGAIIMFYIGATSLKISQVMYEKTSEGVRRKVRDRRQ